MQLANLLLMLRSLNKCSASQNLTDFQKLNKMSTKDFTTSILVDQTPAQVFNAINNVRDWWSGEIIGGTSKLNDEFTYRYKDFHLTKQKIVEMIEWEPTL